MWLSVLHSATSAVISPSAVTSKGQRWFTAWIRSPSEHASWEVFILFDVNFPDDASLWGSVCRINLSMFRSISLERIVPPFPSDPTSLPLLWAYSFLSWMSQSWPLPQSRLVWLSRNCFCFISSQLDLQDVEQARFACFLHFYVPCIFTFNVHCIVSSNSSCLCKYISKRHANPLSPHDLLLQTLLLSEADSLSRRQTLFEVCSPN